MLELERSLFIRYKNAMTMMDKIAVLFFLLLAPVFFVHGQSNLRLVQPFEALQFILKTPGDKSEVLDKADRAEIVPTVIDFSGREINSGEGLVLLDGESFSLGIDINNKEKRSVEYIIAADLPEEWKVTVRRQALLPDYYSYPNPNKPYVKFIGDALPRLIKKEGGWAVTLLQDEVARFYVDFEVDKGSFTGSEIALSWKKEGERAQTRIPISISCKQIPQEIFNSVIFNNNSFQMGRYVDRWLNVGLNNLIIYSFPTYKFDSSGTVIGEMNTGTEDSKEFSYVVDMWSKKNQPFLFYWNKRFERLAPLINKEGVYLEPYSPEWNKAYTSLVKKAFAYIKGKNPNISEDHVILYVEDEITSGNYTKIPSDKVKKVESLLKEIKKSIPQFKVFLTLSMYSYPVDLDIAKNYADILVPMAYMPDQLPRRAPASYNPNRAFDAHLYSAFPSGKARIDNLKSGYPISYTDFESKGSRGEKIWNYMVSSGKASDIMDYRVLPIYSILLGREGMSWWAFSDRKGSSWLPYDQKSLDYSMIYNKEMGNELYQYWNKEQSEDIIPSIRIYASRAGIQDAKLLKYLLKNQPKLSPEGKKEFAQLIDKLSQTLNPAFTQVDPAKYLTLEQYEQISQGLRRLYISL